MANIDKIKRILENGETIIDIIQENLDKTSGEIKRIIEQETYNSRRTIERNFEKLYKGLYAQHKTLTNYIKQIKEENTYQIKTDIQNAKQTIEILELIDKYKFCKIRFKDGHISKDNMDIENINTERIAKAILSAEVYIYPNLEEDNLHYTPDIYNSNKEFINKNIIKGELKENQTLINLYRKNKSIKINGLEYHINDREWIEENVKNINNIKLSDNLSNYKTIFYNTKRALKIIKNTHKENVYQDKDIENHYKKSIQTILNNITHNEKIIFNKLLHIENNNEIKHNLSIKDLSIELHHNMEKYIQRLYRQSLIDLLIKGYIHIA